MGRKIRVNISNVGKIFGITTPVHNLSMDYELYKFLKELGVGISEYVEPVKAEAVEETKPVEKEETEKVIDEHLIETVASTKEEAPVEAWLSKEVYTEEELAKVTKEQMKQILNYRGHYSLRTGPRDLLAPKFMDNRPELIEKIIKTNKKID